MADRRERRTEALLLLFAASSCSAAKAKECADFDKCRGNITYAMCERSRHPFDRVVFCILPYYETLSLAARRASESATTHCVATDFETAREELERSLGSRAWHRHDVPFDTAKLLNALLGPSLRFIGTTCSRKKLGAVEATSRFPPNSTAWRAVHTDVLRLMSPEPSVSSSLSLPPPPPRHLVLIQRALSRTFDNQPLLISRLEAATGLPVVIYRGNESALQVYASAPPPPPTTAHSLDPVPLQTLLVFGNAAAIVGFHGAGHVNAVFTHSLTQRTHFHCISIDCTLHSLQ